MRSNKLVDLQAGKDYISNNSLSSFRKCPFKFETEYVNKIKPIYKAVSLYFGQCLHQALDYHYTGAQNPDLTIEYFESYFDGAQEEQPIMWSTSGARKDGGDFADAETAKKYGVMMLQKYFDRYLEEDVNMEILESEKEFEFDLDGIKYTGIIDQIVKIDGKVYGRDFKFMAQKMDSEYLSMDNQISGYYLGAKSLGYDLDGFIYDVGYKYKVPAFDRIYVTRTKEQLDAFLEDTKEAIKALQSGAKYKNISSECRTCHYKQLCVKNGDLGEIYTKS